VNAKVKNIRKRKMLTKKWFFRIMIEKSVKEYYTAPLKNWTGKK